LEEWYAMLPAVLGAIKFAAAAVGIV
jgi:hypothetical protein